MSLNDYAYYNLETGLIENVVWLDGDTIGTLVDFPEQGYGLVDLPTELVGEWSMCGIGWSYINGQFVEPPKPEPTPIPAEENQPQVQGAQTL